MTETYVVTDEAGAVVASGSFDQLFPTVKPSANGPDANFLSSVNAHILHGAPAYDPLTHKPVPSSPYLDGETWRDETLALMTPEDIAAYLASAKAVKIAALSAEFAARRNTGVIVSGNLYATTNDGHQELKALKERLDRVGGTQKAVTRAGDFIEANATQATAIFTAVDDYIAACWSREYDLRVEINAATDATELEAIDITSGWPVSEQPQ